ncbi:MAG: Holliday junction resolvase RuvX [Holosporaceae bacterium]|nr:Holliday junction resolvase RuvX [Holosporaceae bacterium]
MKNLVDVDVDELLSSESTAVGLDVGDKTVGMAVADRRIKIAGGITTVARTGIIEKDCELIRRHLEPYKIGLVIFGWPVQMNGIPGEQCEKVLKFVTKLSARLPANYAEWDERFSSSAVDDVMIQANLSRRKRKKFIDKTAAVYILQGALDFLNRTSGG